MSPLRLLLPLATALLLAGTASSQAPANDNFADRTDLGSNNSETILGDLEGSTLESGEFSNTFPENGTIWWTWEAPEAGLYEIGWPNSESHFVYEIFAGDSLESLTPVQNGDFYDYEIDTNNLLFYAAPGKPVSIQVSANYYDFGSSVSFGIKNSDKPYVNSIIVDPGTVDTGSAEQATVTVTAELTTPGGMEKIVLRVTDTEHRIAASADYDIYTQSPELARISGDAEHGVYQATLILPRYRAPGDWPISVYFEHTGRNIFLGSPHDVPFTEEVTSSLATTNSGSVDMAAPTISELTFTPATVDVSGEAQEIAFRLVASDDIGLARAIVVLKTEDNSNYYSTEILSADAPGGLFEGSVTIPSNIPPTVLKPVINVYDTLDRRTIQSAFSSSTPLDPTFTQEVTIENSGPVDTPPILERFELSASTVDISDGPQTISVLIEASDPFSEVTSVNVCIYPFTTSVCARPVGLARDEEAGPGIFTGTLEVPAFIPPGPQKIVFSLRDASGQSRQYSDSSTLNPVPEGIISSLEIVNNGLVEQERPTLTSVTFSETEVDVSEQDQDVEVTVVAGDDTALTMIQVMLINPEISEPIDPYNPEDVVATADINLQNPIQGDLRGGTFAGTLTIPAGSAPGELQARVRIKDVYYFFDEYGYDVSAPLPEGSDTSITITNDIPVNTPPVLTSIEFATDSIDVGGEAQDVIVTVNATDDYGIAAVYIDLYQIEPNGPFTYDPIFIEEPQFSLVSGTATNGTYEFTVRLSGYISPMRIGAGVALVDELGQQSNYGGYDYLPSPTDPELVITNSALTSFPDILNGFTISPPFVDVTEGNQNAWVRIETSDTRSSIADIEVSVGSPDISNSPRFSRFYPDGLQETSPGVFEGRIEIDRTAETGNYPVFLSIQPESREDTNLHFHFSNDNTSHFGGDQGSEFPEGSVSSIEVVNNGLIDTSPPVLTSLSFTPSVIDVTEGGRKVDFEIRASDDVGIEDIRLSLGFEEAGSEVSWNTSDAPEDGTRQEAIYRGEVTIPGHLSPGNLLATITLYDEFRNRSIYSARSEINSMPPGSVGTIDVINDGAIDAPPVLHSLVFSETVVDVTSGSKFIEVLAVTSDDFEYVSQIFLSFIKPEGGSLRVRLYPSSELPEGNLKGYLQLSAASQPGAYSLENIYLYAPGTESADVVRYNGSSGLAFPSGVDSEFVIQNSNQILPISVPEVLSLTFSQNSVDVTDSEKSVMARIEAFDEVGIESIYLSLEPIAYYGGNNTLFIELSASDLISGTIQSGIYEKEIVIPTNFSPGVIRPSIDIYSNSGGSNNYSYYDAGGFPEGAYETLNVLNFGIENRAPFVVALSRGAEVVTVNGEDVAIPIRLEVADDFGKIETVGLSASGGGSYFSINRNGWVETLEGVYTQDLIIPVGANPGDYLFQVYLRDSDNFSEYYGGLNSYAEPLPSGADTGFTIVNSGATDTAPPEVFAVEFSPNPVSRNRLPVSVKVIIGATDSLAGISSGWFRIREEQGSGRSLENISFIAEDLEAGDANAAVFMFDLLLDSLPSTPRVFSELSITDRLGLNRRYRDYRSLDSEYPEGTESLMIVDSYNDAYDAWVEAHTDIPANLTSPCRRCGWRRFCQWHRVLPRDGADAR